MGVWTTLFGGTDRRRTIVRARYAKSVAVATKDHRESPYSPHVIGLYSALGTCYATRRNKVTVQEILCELTPFLVMEEYESVEAVAEYAVFKEHAIDTQRTWLSNSINTALESLTDDSYRRMATIGMLNHVAWCALLNADTATMIELWTDSFKREEESEGQPVKYSLHPQPV